MHLVLKLNVGTVVTTSKLKVNESAKPDCFKAKSNLWQEIHFV